MKNFNVLETEIKPGASIVLEASAGTGKTYSIEHLVTRLLIEIPEEGLPPAIEQILVVTFTKAAAAELKSRIRQNLQNALHALQNSDQNTPYLSSIILKGPKVHSFAIQRLKQALVEFDSAYITTIHSFCFRAIAENSDEGSFFRFFNEEKASYSDLLLWEVLAHLFKTEAFNQSFTSQQLTILLRSCRDRMLTLAQEVMKIISKGLKIESPPSNEELKTHFLSSLSSFQKSHFGGSVIQEKIELECGNFCKACEGRTKTLKTQYQSFIARLITCMDQGKVEDADLDSLSGSLDIFDIFSQQNLKQKKTLSQDIQQIIHFLQHAIRPILYSWGDFPFLLARLAHLSQEELQVAYEKTGTMDYSYLLLKMEKLSLNPHFQKALQAQFKRIIIDEFQDTDPTQWKIFKNLFYKSKVPFVLVGDPKQSIYSFRSADIYTYLDALEALGDRERYALQTNYRSSPRLIEGFNLLFDSRHTGNWMALPLKKRALPYLSVLPSNKKDTVFKEEPVIHFLAIDAKNSEKWTKEPDWETHFLFPYFAKEIMRLHQEKKIPLRKIAILVRDHAQSDRLVAFLRERGLPVVLQKSAMMDRSLIAIDLIYLLRAVLAPQNLGILQAALGTQFFQWNCQFVENSERLTRYVELFSSWKEKWQKKGIVACLEAILLSHQENNGATIEEAFVTTQEGRQCLHELNKIIAWLTKREKKLLSPEKLLEELVAIVSMEHFAQESLKMAPLEEEDALPILTLHMSKGLEFDVVFALGVMNRPPVDHGIIPLRKGNDIILKAVEDQGKEHQFFLEECDAEKARQLYVAFTRAKEKLYIPVVDGRKAPELGKAAPIELWLGRLGQDGLSWESLYSSFGSLNLESLRKMCGDGQLMCIEELQPDQNPPHCKERDSPNLMPPRELAMPNFETPVSVSFTSLAKTEVNFSEVHKPPHDFEAAHLSAHTLPASSRTGKLLHQILENFPKEIPSKPHSHLDLIPFIRKYTVFTPFQVWEDVLAKIVYLAYTIPLGRSDIVLADVRKDAMYQEMEFLFPMELVKDLPECSLLQGEVKGVIDLVFLWKGRYYLLDWKSNWLGPDPSFYSASSLKTMMRSHRYDLQAALYATAFKAYLRSLKISASSFGGVFYLFLRGFDGVNGLYSELS